MQLKIFMSLIPTCFGKIIKKSMIKRAAIASSRQSKHVRNKLLLMFKNHKVHYTLEKHETTSSTLW